MNNTEKKIQSAFNDITPEQAEPMVNSISPADFKVSSETQERISKEVLNRMAEKKINSTNKAIKIGSIAAAAVLLTGGVIAIVNLNSKAPAVTIETTEATTTSTEAVETEAAADITVETESVEFEYVSKTASVIDEIRNPFASNRVQEFLDQGYVLVTQDVPASNVISAAWLEDQHDTIIDMELIYEFDTHENAQAYYDQCVAESAEYGYTYVENVTDEYTEYRHEEDWGYGFFRIYHNENIYEYGFYTDVSIGD